MYHNTQALEDTRLYEQKAMTQDELIFAYFKGCRYGELIPPSEIHRWVLPNAPITSVRRSLTGLTKAGLLVKTNHLTDGPYGRPEGLWRLADPVQEELFK